MSFIDAARSVERQRFFDGQRLFAADLQGLEAFNREMRWLHNQSLHQPGIGNGFEVHGRKDGREVRAGAGYAVDDLGREIVLTGERVIPVPPVAGDPGGGPQRYVLTVRYPSDEDLEEVELREGLCDTRGAVRLREEPVFCWVPLNPDGSPAASQAEILSGRALVLAEIAVRNCKLDKDLSVAQRRNARPAAVPRIACGMADPTPWQDWPLGGDEQRLFAGYALVGGVQADIDTSAAGFLVTPGYFARIDGPRILTLPTEPVQNGETSDGVLNGDAPEGVFDGLLTIVDAKPGGFRARVLVLALDAESTAGLPPLPELLSQWRVGWMGVEG
ncbi:hypothetical protein [Nonomuraea sp. NPDC002799]